MISLQSHNQVLYHLMQLTSAFGSRSTPCGVKQKGQNETVRKKTEVLCESSLVETARNCQGMPVLKLNASDVRLCTIEKDNLRLTLDKVAVNISRRRSEKNTKWTESFVSGSSFAENKQGFPSSRVQGTIVLPAVCLSSQQQRRLFHSLHNTAFFHNHTQTRGISFRKVAPAPPPDNMSIISMLKKRFKESRSPNEKAKTNLSFGGKRATEKYNALFNATEMTEEEQKRVKFAFLEGYEAGLDRPSRHRPLLNRILANLITLAFVIVGVWYFGGSLASVFKISFNSVPEVDPEEITVTFDDVKGVDEVKQELCEVVEFLRNPEKFSSLGGKLPKGILLVGPPGTGKTLLARAVAGEAGVPFFHAAGPEFDEVLVGQGARRVRDLFKAAKERAPCVVFLDEIDSIGSKRTSSTFHPYANQTINQLLSEMDGFHQNEGVIVLGATNRREDLDNAVLRPGRFDVEMHVHKPNYMGRVELFKLYLSKVQTKDTNPELLARSTTGATGADIENMVNQAALRAAAEGAEYVTTEHIEYARDKIAMGPAGQARVPDEHVNQITAYHESGHALVATYTKYAQPVYKITILPRGPSLGHTSYLPDKDEYLNTKAQYLALLDVSMGGRAAEEIIFGSEHVTSGAKSDLMKATKIAEEMVKGLGMSEKVGLRFIDDSSCYLGDCHTYTNELVDIEVKRLLQEALERAKTILRTHSKELKLLAEALLKYETIDGSELPAVLEGKKT